MDNKILLGSFGTFIVTAVAGSVIDPHSFNPLTVLAAFALVLTGVLAITKFMTDLGKAMKAFNEMEQKVDKRMTEAEKTVSSMNNKMNTLMGETLRRKL